MRLERLDPWRVRIPRHGGMRVDGIVYAGPELMAEIERDPCLEQVANVAHLPGIVGASLAMPDIHWGYGFPIGGVAAMDAEEGVISPGGVGYDINCGVRLLRSTLTADEVRPRLRELVAQLFRNVPTGVGAGRRDLRLGRRDLERVLARGAAWAVGRGMGEPDDLLHIEEGGCLATADPEAVSARACERGGPQLGTLGSGNHFCEVQEVEEVFDEKAAAAFGLARGQVTVMLHSGSRGLGHQVCSDFLKRMLDAARRYGIALPDRQLCCAPIRSEEGREYLGAMAAAANFAFANRQVMTHWVRESFAAVFGLPPARLGLGVVYDVCHNIAKFETLPVEGKEVRLCVHRKGATRALPPGHAAVPPAYRKSGQPVLIPGDMGTGSYVLAGTERAFTETFGSTCHGAGRVMSRTQAVKSCRGRSIPREMAERGVIVMSSGKGTLMEEIPEAYKNLDEVVEVVHRAGLSKKVARLRAVGCIKG